MSDSLISRRQFVGGYLLAAGLSGCGGGSGSADGTDVAAATPGTTGSSDTSTDTTATDPGTAVDTEASTQASASRLPVETPPAAGTILTSVLVRSDIVGRMPYMATVLPRRGQVPAGSTLESPDDGTLRASVISTHDDGSAAVVIVSGVTLMTSGVTNTIRIQAGRPRTEPAMDPSLINSVVKTVSVAFGDTLGTATISRFDAPERIWWANARTVCARYRVAAPNAGATALEAVIDIQLFGDRAFVEVVVENAKVDPAQATTVAPAAGTYAAATVMVNQRTLRTVSSSAVPVEGRHSFSRAWYASAWIGSIDPGLVAHQAVADLQMHPLLFKCDQPCSADLSGYAADTYTPWGAGRKPGANMGGAGDVPGIGPLTQWDAHWLQSGDKTVANAVLAQAYMTLHWNINFRSVRTGLVPTHTEIDLKSFNGNHSFPLQSNSSETLTWELMHHPAVGLAAFCVRPSPVLIELAQKVAIWNALWPTNWDNNTVQPTGVFRGGGCTIRGRAWAIRSLAHAIFLTPDALPWKAAAKQSLSANITYFDGYRTNSKSKLGVMWEGDPDYPLSLASNDGAVAAGGPAFAIRGWFYHYFVTEIHKVASARLLTGASQTAADTLADWACSFPVRWVNEQTNGGWRFIPYSTVIGRNYSMGTGAPIDMPADWGAMRAYTHSDLPSALSGTWYFGTGDTLSYAGSYGNTDYNRPRYVDYFWAALVAAAERNIVGAAAAWSTVNSKVSNLSSWRTGFGVEPRWGSTPRVLPTQQLFASGSAAGSYDAATFTWTPASTNGIVNSASWAIVPKRTWVRVVGSNLTALDAAVRAASPTWSSSQLNWDGMMNSWAGITPDTTNSRAWIMGGGHTNGWQNGLYRFDAYRMAWSIERAPSDRNAWPSDYANGSSATNYPPAMAQFNTDSSSGVWRAINGSFYDQLQDQRPTARHTYQSMVYDGERNQLVMACRRLWKFDLTTHDWSYRRAIADLPDGGDGVSSGGYLDAENSIGILDEATGTYLTQSSGSGGKNAAIGYNLGGNSWVNWSVPWSNRAVYACRNGRYVMCWSPGGGDASFNQNGRYWLYSLETRSTLINGVDCQLGGGLTYSYFNYSGNSREIAIEYIPPLNRYWLSIYTSANAWEFFELDPTTTPYKLTKLSLPGLMPSQPDWLLRRIVYLPGINALVMFGFASDTISIYRF